MLREFDGEAAVWRAMQAGQKPLDDGARHELEPAELGQVAWMEEINTCARHIIPKIITAGAATRIWRADLQWAAGSCKLTIRSW